MKESGKFVENIDASRLRELAEKQER